MSNIRGSGKSFSLVAKLQQILASTTTLPQIHMHHSGCSANGRGRGSSKGEQLEREVPTTNKTLKLSVP